MSLLKRRPEIALFAPVGIELGQPFRVRVILRCAEPVPVDAVQVELVGEGVWHSHSQHGRHRNTQPFARWAARPVTERTELSAGEHALPVSFELPADAPPSYTGRLLSVEWSVRVHVDIPWWPDARATFSLFVAPSSAAAAEPPPQRVFASSADGPEGRRPYVEVSLGSTAIEPGERLRGRAALANTAHNDYRALRLSLVAVESVPSLLSSLVQHDVVSRWTLPLREPEDDVPIALELAMPTSLVPGFRTRTLSLAWFLEVRVDVAWALDTTLWIPVVVHPPRPHGRDRGEAPAPLAVGSERLALVWAEAARRSGWNHARGELSREVDDFRLVVRRDHRGRAGLRLRAEATFLGGRPWRTAWGALGDLAADPAASPVADLEPDLDLGLRADAGRLRCRDAGHARVLAEHTDVAAAACPVAEADDRRIVCLDDDGGTRVEPVAELAIRFEALVRALVRAREQLPAPADMADAVPAFRAAARRLGGELDVASMDVWGVRDEVPFSLQTRWDDDGALARTVLEVRPALPVDARWHQRWSGGGPLGSLPEGLAELVVGAEGVAVDARSIRLWFPPCGGELEPLVARLEGLLAVAQRLSGRGLGYR